MVNGLLRRFAMAHAAEMYYVVSLRADVYAYPLSSSSMPVLSFGAVKLGRIYSANSLIYA